MNREEFTDYYNHGNKVKYVFFWGHQKPISGVTKSCFSQWYEAPFLVEGKEFMTAEHYMMYRKALLFKDAEAATKVLAATNPGAAKAIGRAVKGFEQTIWEQHRFEIVVGGNVAKFGAHPELKDFLLATGQRVLVEASPRDRIWGIGMSENNPDSCNPNLWRGQNLLGFALMEAREQLLNQD